MEDIGKKLVAVAENVDKVHSDGIEAGKDYGIDRMLDLQRRIIELQDAYINYDEEKQEEISEKIRNWRY